MNTKTDTTSHELWNHVQISTVRPEIRENLEKIYDIFASADVAELKVLYENIKSGEHLENILSIICDIYNEKDSKSRQALTSLFK